MAEEHDFPSSSDESDEDYVPGNAGSEPGSENESEGDPESEGEENKKSMPKKRRGKNSKNGPKKKRKVEVEKEEDENPEEQVLNQEEEKKRADSIWESFLKDTGTTPKAKPKVENSPEKPVHPVTKSLEKVKITKVFNFAGEEVKVEEEVAVSSAEAHLNTSAKENPVQKKAAPTRGGSKTVGGLSSVLGQLGKKTKISTLEKSKLDWENFKKEENIAEEISTHNKGKHGYLERQDFLQRADLRQFEIEKKMRSSSRR